MPGSWLSDMQIGAILVLRKEGPSTRAIADRVNCNQSTVCRFLKHFDETGETDRPVNSGRKRKTSEQLDRAICREVMKDRRITIATVMDMYNLRGVVSESTISRRIFEGLGFHSWFATKKGFISEKNRIKRLEWYLAHRDWTIEQWRRVLWSDESPFVLRYNGRVRVWRLPSERYEPGCTVATIKHDVKINVWGYFTAHGVGELYFIHEERRLS